MDEQLERLTDEEAVSEKLALHKFPELEDSSESEQSEGEEKWTPSGELLRREIGSMTDWVPDRVNFSTTIL